MPICYRASTDRASGTHAQESVAEREPGFDSALAQYVVTFVAKDPARILGRLQQLTHRGSVSVSAARKTPSARAGTSRRCSVNQLVQIVHYDMRAMTFQLLSVPLSGDTDHKSEVAAKPGLDPRDGILDDDRPCRFNSKQPRSNKESIGGGFSGQLFCLDHGAIDAYLEQIVQIGGLQDGRTVFTRGDDRYFKPVTAQLSDESNASLVSLHPHVLDGLGDQSVLAVPEPAHRFRLRRVLGISLRKLYAA